MCNNFKREEEEEKPKTGREQKDRVDQMGKGREVVERRRRDEIQKLRDEERRNHPKLSSLINKNPRSQFSQATK